MQSIVAADAAEFNHTWHSFLDVSDEAVYSRCLLDAARAGRDWFSRLDGDWSHIQRQS